MSSALAAPTVILDPVNNVGIDSATFSVGIVGNVITIDETWTTLGAGVILFRDLDNNTQYEIRKIIRNQTGSSWTQFENELFDPVGANGTGEDDAADGPATHLTPPVGYTVSGDSDGLSFGQFGPGATLPRTSTVFATVFSGDGEPDPTDYLRFSNGTLADGGVDNYMTFGLTDFEDNEVFALKQVPTAGSTRIPDAASTYTLFGFALAGLGFLRRRLV
jgi:hypothetical protein